MPETPTYRRPKRDGWSVLATWTTRKECGLPHRTRLGAVLELVFGLRPIDRFGQPATRRTIVRHDDEMRRWDYHMGLIEPTDQERAQLPTWHENYRSQDHPLTPAGPE